jgi:hypothetical protein
MQERSLRPAATVSEASKILSRSRSTSKTSDRTPCIIFSPQRSRNGSIELERNNSDKKKEEKKTAIKMHKSHLPTLDGSSLRTPHDFHHHDDACPWDEDAYAKKEILNAHTHSDNCRHTKLANTIHTLRS